MLHNKLLKEQKRHVSSVVFLSRKVQGVWTSSIEKGAEVAFIVASELVSLKGDEDLAVHHILDSSAARPFLVSTQLTT